MRVNKLKREMKKKLIDCIVIFSSEEHFDPSLLNITGIETDFGILMVFLKRKPILWLSGIDEKKTANNFLIKYIDSKSNPFQDLKGVENIGLNEAILPCKKLKIIKTKIKKETKTKFFDASEILSNVREIKDLDEQDKIIKAVDITETIFKEMFDKIKSGTFSKESEIQEFLKISAIKKGVELAFTPVIASGENAANPHYYPKKESKLQKGFCVIDFGVKYKGYSSDITRTFYLGKPNKQEIKEYGKVLSAIEWCEKNIKPKKPCKEVFEKFTKNNFEMIHALGHGVGIKVHELPYVGNGKDVFKTGQCVAIEPGVYQENKFGIRIEDTFILQEKGLKRLGKLCRNLKCF